MLDDLARYVSFIAGDGFLGRILLWGDMFTTLPILIVFSSSRGNYFADFI